MDMILTPDDIALREQIRAFLAAALSPRLRRAAALTAGVFAEPDIALPWQRILHAQGWLAYDWPKSYGGTGWTSIQRYIFEKECALANAPALPSMGLKLVGPVIYSFGTDAQKATHLPPLLSGDTFWAQGFSEPGSGSDLASLRTRAVRTEAGYRVTGSKIWTTQAQHANRLFCLARTDTETKPQRGISFLLIDMALPGVTVRPILSASGEHEVNEVFLDNVLVPAGGLVGEEGQGWTIAKFLLENERGKSCFSPTLAAGVCRLRQILKTQPQSPADAAHYNDRIARLSIATDALEITELRTLVQIQRGEAPGRQALMAKLIASEIRQDIDTLASEMFGHGGLQFPAERPFYGDAVPGPIGSSEAQVACARYLNSRAWSVFGGTSEIQLSIIAKSALGL